MGMNKTIIVMLMTLVMFGTNPARAEKIGNVQKPFVISNASMALPEGCSVKVRWVSPPLDSAMVENAYWLSLCFAVDSEGNPWIGYDYSYIISPVKKCQLKLPSAYTSFSYTSNGAFLATTCSDLCFITPPKELSLTNDNIPQAMYQPIANLPAEGCRVFAGSDKSIFLAAQRDNGGSDVYQYIPGKSAIRGYVKVFSSDDEVTAVSGDANNLYAAIKGAILKVSIPDNTVTKLYASSRESVRCLAHYPGVGLFYSTDSSVGYIGAKGCIPFMAVPDTLISLRNGTLYVLFEKSLGIIALDNIGSLKKFDKAMKKIPLSYTKDIKITNIRFFEAGNNTPDYSCRTYSSKFDYKTTRYVYCQLDIKNLQYKKKEHKQTFSIELYQSSLNKLISTKTINLDFMPNKPDVVSGAGFGKEEPGALYPGSYTAQIYLNGTLVGSKKFSVIGEPNLAEAAKNNDVSTVTRLIKSGSDLNAKWKYGYTPLMLAVIMENTDIVKLLLDAGADVNAKSDDGDTALILEGRNSTDDPFVTKLLLSHGADVNAQDANGTTALQCSAYHRRLSVVKLLLESGAKTEIKDNNGLTALMVSKIDETSNAASKVQLIELLLSHGSNPEAKDTSGRTAIFQAIDGLNVDAAAVLVKHGANVNALNNNQRSVLGYLLDKYKTAMNYREDRNKLINIARILQENGADLDTSEFANIYFDGIDQILDAQHMSHLCEMSDFAAANYNAGDPYLRKACIRGLLNAAQQQVSDKENSYYHKKITYLCEEAVNRYISWEINCPEIYFSVGLICTQSGDYQYARSYLQEYLNAAPNGSCAVQAKEILDSLK